MKIINISFFLKSIVNKKNANKLLFFINVGIFLSLFAITSALITFYTEKKISNIEFELIEKGGKPFNPTDNPLDIFKISSNTIPAGSRLSNLSTQQKGEQLFKNDITFAAQGGIMNARKQIQRVA